MQFARNATEPAHAHLSDYSFGSYFLNMMDHSLPMGTYRNTILSYAISFGFSLHSRSRRMNEKHTQPPRSDVKGPASGARLLSVLILLFPLLGSTSFAQDWVRTGSGLGVEKVRLAVPDFKPSNNDPQNAALLNTFNDTFCNDLHNSCVFQLFSKHFYHIHVP